MEKEYSVEVRGKVHAYRFEPWEKLTIAKLLKKEIPKLKKKIDRIIDDPKNEGQATYQTAIEEIDNEINVLEDIIKEFSK